jgi:hypothetical protein
MLNYWLQLAAYDTIQEEHVPAMAEYIERIWRQRMMGNVCEIVFKEGPVFAPPPRHIRSPA